MPRRKSSMVPEGGFAMPDLSSDRRRSSNAYGVLLEPPAQQNPDNSISSTEMFEYAYGNRFELFMIMHIF